MSAKPYFRNACDLDVDKSLGFVVVPANTCLLAADEVDASDPSALSAHIDELTAEVVAERGL